MPFMEAGTGCLELLMCHYYSSTAFYGANAPNPTVACGRPLELCQYSSPATMVASTRTVSSLCTSPKARCILVYALGVGDKKLLRWPPYICILILTQEDDSSSTAVVPALCSLTTDFSQPDLGRWHPEHHASHSKMRQQRKSW